MNANEIRLALVNRYARPNWLLFREVASRIGAVSYRNENGSLNKIRYADYIAVSLSKAQGKIPLSIVGIEVKISRSDYRNELKDPTKSIISQYCDEWYLACPKNMIDPKELPNEEWGLIYIMDDLSTRLTRKSVKPSAVLSKEFQACMLNRYHAEVSLPAARVLHEYRDMLKKPVSSQARFLDSAQKINH